jgi:hypothetical protein
VRVARAATVVALTTAYFLHVFRFPDDTAVTTGLGDWVDPYFINYLLEHWHHSIWTLSAPSSPPMYFPARGTLGYSHGLILYAPFYLSVRPLLDPFQAHNATLFLVLVSGSLCLYALLRKFAGVRFIEALLLTIFFFSSRNVVNGGTAVWSQRGSVFLIPPLLLITMMSVRMPGSRFRLALSGLSGLLLSLLFTQDFYTAAFALLILALLLAGVLLLARQSIGDAIRELQQIANSMDAVDPTQLPRRPSRRWLIVAACGLVWAGVVLVHPIERTTIASLRFSATDVTRPLLFALIAGGWFLFWHIRRVELALRHSRGEIAFKSQTNAAIAAFWKRNKAFLLALAGGSLVGCLVFLWIYLGAYREHSTFPDEHLMNSLRPFDPFSWSGPAAPYDSLRSFMLVFATVILAWVPGLEVDKRARLFGAWFLLVSILVLAIPLKFDGFSIWKAVFAPIPGFSVIRDSGRIIPLYELSVVLLAAFFLAQLHARSFFRKAIIFFVLVLLAADWNPEVFDFGRSRTVYAQWLKAPIDIDPSCRSFFIKGASQAYMSRSFHMWGLYNVDSMFISLDHAIPTLNGYSAWSPDGWGLANPQESGYRKAVQQWIDRHKLEGVCELDIEKRTMKPITRLD